MVSLTAEADRSTIKLGFLTDFASIPPLLQYVVGGPLGRYGRAAVIHDWAYAKHFDRSHSGRRDCDLAMLRLMREDNTKPWQRALIYAGVRIGGGIPFYRAPITRRKIEEIQSSLEYRRKLDGYLSTQVANIGLHFESKDYLKKGWTKEFVDSMLRNLE